MHKKYNTEEFINKSIKIHGCVYDYSLVNFVDTKTKVTIVCKLHGKFEQRPNNHLSGSGCKKCGKIQRAQSERFTKEGFLKKALDAHGDKFNYSLVEYLNSQTKITIICPTHGEFKQTPASHLKHGCNKCENKIISKEEFLATSSKIHINKYSYSEVDYTTSQSKVKIVCPEHGIFEQRAYHHMNGSGCPKCKTSNGVIRIYKFLENLKIEFVTEKKFVGCVNIYPLPFDFYLPKHNLCIEFDGQQHFKPMGYKTGNKKYKDTIKRDKIKDEFCISNNINLIRIKYMDDIEKILSDLFV